MVAQITITAMQLQAAVDHLETRIGGKPLRLRGKPGGSRLARTDGYGSAVQQKPRCFYFSRVVRDPELQRLEIRKARTELLSVLHVIDGTVETKLGAADRTRTDIQTAAVKSCHCNLEALSLGADPLRNRYPAVLEHDHRRRLRFPAKLLFLGAE